MKNGIVRASIRPCVPNSIQCLTRFLQIHANANQIKSKRLRMLANANQDARRKTQHTGHNESRKRHQTLLKTLWMTVMRTTGRENYYIKQEPVLLSNEEPRARTDVLALRGHSNSGKHLQLSFRKSRYRGINVTCKSEKCYSDHWRENLQTPAALAAAAHTTGRATHHEANRK